MQGAGVFILNEALERFGAGVKPELGIFSLSHMEKPEHRHAMLFTKIFALARHKLHSLLKMLFLEGSEGLRGGLRTLVGALV